MLYWELKVVSFIRGIGLQRGPITRIQSLYKLCARRRQLLPGRRHRFTRTRLRSFGAKNELRSLEGPTCTAEAAAHLAGPIGAGRRPTPQQLWRGPRTRSRRAADKQDCRRGGTDSGGSEAAPAPNPRLCAWGGRPLQGLRSAGRGLRSRGGPARSLRPTCSVQLDHSELAGFPLAETALPEEVNVASALPSICDSASRATSGIRSRVVCRCSNVDQA
ncbi:hypothetical protein NDU88_003284 [Pleurodeles waltl]|uniref:Uncharacterized protein n=1 Tax=Pleurodeles waltl TaxID=8319 RepID=A0AAV7V1B6_PLEWA|nr:hypothetical protein NDU88_003284 [Pleurodeles waltl]